MIIAWRGRGVLVAGIAYGCLLAAEFATRAYFHDSTYYRNHGWPKLAGFLAAAAIVWGQVSTPGDIVTNVRDDRRLGPLFRPRDSLMLLPVRHWPLILCGLGFVFYFVRG